MVKDLPEEFELFVEQLSEQTLLTDRQSEVYALRECGYDRQEIVQTLDISEGAVDSHWSKARKRADQPGSQVDGHFFDTQLGKVPLLWQDSLLGTTSGPSYVLSRPLVEVPNTQEQAISGETEVFTVYDAGELNHRFAFEQVSGVQHIPFRNSSELYQVFVDCFSDSLSVREAEQLNGLWASYGREEHESIPDFFTSVFNGQIPETNPEFYTAVDSELRVGFLYAFFISTGEELQFGYENATNRPVTLEQYSTELDWVSVVGKIGSGKSFTKDVLLAQLARQSDMEIIEFDPIQESGLQYTDCIADVKRFDEVDSGEIDDVLDSFASYTRQRIDSSDTNICVVIDQAHYLLNSHPELFRELIEASNEGELNTVLTSTQTLTEYFESEVFSEGLLDSPLWVLHRLTLSDELQETLGVSPIVNNLAVGVENSPYTEAVLKTDGKRGLLCSINPSSTFDIREY